MPVSIPGARLGTDLCQHNGRSSIGRGAKTCVPLALRRTANGLFAPVSTKLGPAEWGVVIATTIPHGRDAF